MNDAMQYFSDVMGLLPEQIDNLPKGKAERVYEEDKQLEGHLLHERPSV
jgi:hypothetical protein